MANDREREREREIERERDRERDSISFTIDDLIWSTPYSPTPQKNYSLLVYKNAGFEGNLDQAVALSIVLLFLAVVVLVGARLLGRAERR